MLRLATTKEERGQIFEHPRSVPRSFYICLLVLIIRGCALFNIRLRDLPAQILEYASVYIRTINIEYTQAAL